MDQLEWIVQKRVNTRSCSYAMKDMRWALERAGCTVEECPPGYWLDCPEIIAKTLFLVRHPTNDSLIEIRHKVTRAAKCVHARAKVRFIGINGAHRHDKETL